MRCATANRPKQARSGAEPGALASAPAGTECDAVSPRGPLDAGLTSALRLLRLLPGSAGGLSVHAHRPPEALALARRERSTGPRELPGQGDGGGDHGAAVGRASDPEPPSRAATRSASPSQTAPVGPRAPYAVVAHPDAAAFDPRSPAVTAARSARELLRDVGQGFGDNEVRGRLDRGQRAGPTRTSVFTATGIREASSPTPASRPPRVRTAREDPMGKLAQLLGRLLGMVEHLPQ